MQKYDKIYLPERKEGVFAFRDNQGDVPVVHHGEFIVLTVEELDYNYSLKANAKRT